MAASARTTHGGQYCVVSAVEVSALQDCEALDWNQVSLRIQHVWGLVYCGMVHAKRQGLSPLLLPCVERVGEGASGGICR